MDNATYQRIDDITHRVLDGDEASASEGHLMAMKPAPLKANGSLACITITCLG